MPALMLLLLCLGAVVVQGSGIDMCQGPFQLPEIVDVSVTPVLDDVERTTEVRVKVEMISKVSLLANWRYFDPNDGLWILSSPDSDTLRASTKSSGNRYALGMQLKLGKAVQNLTLSHMPDDIVLQLDLNYTCNVASLSLTLFNLLGIVRDDLDLPVIMEMPRIRYIVDVKDKFEVKVAVSAGQDGRTPEVYVSCRTDIERRAGSLGAPDVAYSSAEKNVDEESGRNGSVCQVDMRGDLEVTHALLEVTIMTRVNRLYVEIPYEIRRKGLRTPVIMVSSSEFDPASKTRYIATSGDKLHSFCAADAESRPSVNLMKVMKNGGYRRVPPIRQDDTYLSRSVLTFMVKSPEVLERDEYVCVAESGGYKTEQRFTIIRYDEVRMPEPERVPMEKGKVYNLTCEATGAPKPRMLFHWSPPFPTGVYGLSVAKYIKMNKQHEIVNSADIRTRTWEEAGKTYGQVIVEDIEKVFSDAIQHATPDPTRGIGDHSTYYIVCAAYNEYSITSKALASYGNATTEDYAAADWAEYFDFWSTV